jgi:hypothetical protein
MIGTSGIGITVTASDDHRFITSVLDHLGMPKSRRRTAVVAMSVLLAAAVAGAVALIFLNRPPVAAPASAPSVRTATVSKGDLSNTRSIPGTLGFGAQRQIKGTGTGTVTRLPAAGDVTAAGKPLYWVNDRPVPVFFGATPLFRKLETPGTKGSDVAVVMDNLAQLGYRVGRRPDDDTKAEFTTTVSDALKRWQKKAGLEETGTLDVGQILVLDAPVRVASVQAQPGSTATEALFTVTPEARVVTLSVGVADAGALKAGTAVAVARPDAKEVPAKVTTVSHAPPAENGQSNQPKLDVTVVPDNPADVADLDSAPVQVKITTESRTGVLVVPVEALIALREGGYAVQLPGGQLRAVQTGMYAQNKVEVTGAGVTEGLEVVIAS